MARIEATDDNIVVEELTGALLGGSSVVAWCGGHDGRGTIPNVSSKSS